MKKNILGIIAVLGIPLVASASMTAFGIADAESLCGRNEKLVVREGGRTTVLPLLAADLGLSDGECIQSLYVIESEAAVTRSGEEDFASFHAVLTEAGTLGSVLGDRLLETDSLSVEGPVNDSDFVTLWDASYNGRLRAVDLRKAAVVSGKIPDYAFFHRDVQITNTGIKVGRIRRIYLPEGITDIGRSAFGYCTRLTEVNFPSTLRYIGKSAFGSCYSLSSEKLDFGEVLEKIDDQAFYDCRNLTGGIVLPQSLKWIGSAAFYHCPVSEINFPDGLEYLSCLAFIGSNFTKAILPDDCYLCPHGAQFDSCWELTEVHLPENSLFVPAAVCNACESLTTVNIPSGTLDIGEFAFDGADLGEVEFPVCLESIGPYAFGSCNRLERVVLPASLGFIGDNAFYNCKLGEIYSMAAVPPSTNPFMEGDIPSFFRYNSREIPVYVPVGTSELYRQATGWDYFSNYIEVTDFPGGLGVNGAEVESAADAAIYDLTGRRISAPAPGQIYIRNGRKHVAPAR